MFAATEPERLALLRSLIQTLKKIQVPTSPFESGFKSKFSGIVLTVSEALESYRSSPAATQRDKLICSDALADLVKSEISIVTLEGMRETELGDSLVKKLTRCEKEVKLVY